MGEQGSPKSGTTENGVWSGSTLFVVWCVISDKL